MTKNCQIIQNEGMVCIMSANRADINCISLPQPVDSNSIVVVCLKNKAAYCNQDLFKQV